MARKKTPSHPTPSTGPGRAELILVADAAAELRMTAEGFASRAGADVSGLAEALAGPGITIEPLFGVSEDLIRERALEFPDATGADMATFYHVSAPGEDLEALADRLRGLDGVTGAYVKPPGEPPVAIDLEVLAEMAPSEEEPPATTPNFTARQLYLNAAPTGVDARYAWTLSGGRGAGVNIIDCEWGWRFNHEDLRVNQGGVVIGTGISDDDHGTAVLGEISGDRNGFGIEGICPDARVMAASFATLPTARVIRMAADRLRPGDIMLLEIHRRGPGGSGVGQDGFIAIEWWPDDLAAIRYAVARGVIVVEAAGNGARNLDAAIYNTPGAGFPAAWRNPFNPNNPTSGAVLVGAGAPPPGTHGRDHGPDRSRLDFSNYGARVDVQGWGREVTSTGYGNLQGGSDRDRWYTDTFSGTSSASPIVVGVLGCAQGVLRARNRPLLTPAVARTLLRATGSPQQDAPGRPRTQRIGTRPNLRHIIARLVPSAPPTEASVGSAEPAPVRGGVTIAISSSQVTINVTASGVSVASEPITAPAPIAATGYTNGHTPVNRLLQPDADVLPTE
ncbi:S8 family serine peptidase [Gemmata sp. G18]|uniref:S8 family serine peptidase n=1 Tax=Gemmata palustris TaxID=2822762 RepID=A0ABS5BK52_9BACT|nr:S8 family serine peptidase [Gemmata palustris]MBP3954085.1 S8 family serine peptidase [Gemmata palustris]